MVGRVIQVPHNAADILDRIHRQPMPRLATFLPAATVLAAALLSGCDMLGIESSEKAAAVRDADGRAVGAACRHAGRAIEDCYALNRRSDKAAIFAGWRDMNDYMRENGIEAVSPVLTAPPPPTAAPASATAAGPAAVSPSAPAEVAASDARSR
jgi:hypothetical protein